MTAIKNSSLITIISKILNFAFIFYIILFAFFLFALKSMTINYMLDRWIIQFIKFLSTIIILFFLIKIFKNFKSDMFFNFENVKNSRIIGLTIIIASVLISFFNIYSFPWESGILGFTTSVIQYFYGGISWEGIFMGLIILVIALSFKKGEKLQIEQNLII